MIKFGLTMAMGLLLATAVAIAGIGGAPPAQANGETAARAPSELGAAYTGAGSVVVAWPSMQVPSGYEMLIQRDHVSGPGPTDRTVVRIIQHSAGTTNTALDRNPTAGATYQYQARIYPLNSDSAVSVSPVATYHVSIKPHLLTGEPGRGPDGGVVLSWVPGAHPKFVKQQVRRRAAGSSEWTTVAEVSFFAGRYTDSTAVFGTKYSYRVKAVKASGKGGQTNRVKVRAP